MAIGHGQHGHRPLGQETLPGGGLVVVFGLDDSHHGGLIVGPTGGVDARRLTHPGAGTVGTDNLAYGVAVGTLTAMVLFARRVAHLTDVVKVDRPDEDTQVYAVSGELFFASSNDMVYQFDYAGDPANVVIDLSGAHIWDASTVATLDSITTKYAAKGKNVTIVGLDDSSAERHRRLTGRLAGSH